MKLIENTGHIAIVEIDGTKWHMGSEEYYIMNNWTFHMWPHNLKRINPMPHSCARCIHRPFQFQDTKKRMCIPPKAPCRQWGWTKAMPYYDNPDCPEGEWE